MAQITAPTGTSGPDQCKMRSQLTRATGATIPSTNDMACWVTEASFLSFHLQP